MPTSSPPSGLPPSGLLLLHKPPGCTSFDALHGVKRALGTGKIGHTGTLDKFAEGLLVVLAGRALKLSQWFTRCDKWYEGTICFGVETDTLDPEGSPVEHAPPPSREDIEAVLPGFVGDIEQAPPAYSAIHINGQRASDMSRRGLAPQMEKRPVSIYRLELQSWQPPLAGLRVHCSSGTYIRSLARDIARAARSRAHLSALVRTQVAGFTLDNAVPLPQPPAALPLLPITRGIFESLGIPCLEIPPEGAQKMIQGKPLAQVFTRPPVAENTAAVFSGDFFTGIIEKINGKWQYGYVYARN